MPSFNENGLLPLPPGEGRGEGGLGTESQAPETLSTLHPALALADRPPHPDPLPEGEGEGRGLALAVDIGGTFTDVTLQDPATGQSWRAKVPSVPTDPSRAFIAGMRVALDQAGAAPADIARVLHGTTVATNLILEGKGAKAALVTTAGFRHVLDIGRQDIPRSANLYAWRKPRRPVPASRVFEVTERIGPGGDVLVPLDEAGVAVAAEACRRHDVQAVAVCLLHGFANPVHERRVVDLLRAALPGIAVTAATDVLPVVREYERTLATILNATVMPPVATYVGRLAERLAEAGVRAPLMLMQSNGGVAGVATIRRAPALTALSGPAAGVVGARAVAAAAGVQDIITVDIGGTSADISLIKSGRIGLTSSGRVGDWPLPLPMVDMVTVGAGGGSIARVSDGALLVGPASAGADPGPACYGAGGTAATVTDAHLVLGHLPPSLLGGRMQLDPAAAAAAIQREVAEPLGLGLHEAARGILAIADTNMVGAIRVVSVERGWDPRGFTLVPFGGAGSLHGAALAELLGISSVLIPPAPGLLCAEGLLQSDLKAEFHRTLPQAVAPDEGAINAALDVLQAEAQAWLAAEQVADASRACDAVVLMRYEGQGGELAVPWAGTVAAALAAFRAAHQALYGFTMDTPAECVTLRVEATGRMPAAAAQRLAPAPMLGPGEHRTVHFTSGPQDVPVLNRAALGASATFSGPAIVTQLDATTLVPPGWQAEVLQTGAILLRRT